MHDLVSINGVHIEPTNICTLKCSGCARTKFQQQWPQHWKNHSVDVDQVMRFIDIDLSYKNVLLGGVYGDSIYHPDFISLVWKIKQRGATVEIVTNGSHKKQEWWEQLAQLLGPNDLVVFSIDGVPENFTQYRINADWESIETGIRVLVNSSAKTKWKYIPFSYNQNDIEAARQLSISLGIDQFVLDPSDRFDESTQHLRPNGDLLGSRYQSQIIWKQNSSAHSVQPLCANKQQHFIGADGYYSPCCFLYDHRFRYKTMFGKDRTRFNIQNHTLTEILSRMEVQDFYQTLDQHPGCQFNCPNI